MGLNGSDGYAIRKSFTPEVSLDLGSTSLDGRSTGCILSNKRNARNIKLNHKFILIQFEKVSQTHRVFRLSIQQTLYFHIKTISKDDILYVILIFRVNF